MVRRVRIGAIAALVALAGPLGAAAAAETVELSARMRVLASTEPGHTDTFCARAFQTAPPPAIKVNGLDAQVTNITGVEGRCSLEPHCQQAQSGGLYDPNAADAQCLGNERCCFMSQLTVPGVNNPMPFCHDVCPKETAQETPNASLPAFDAIRGDYDEPVSGAQAESGPDLRVIPSASAAPGVGGGALAAATLGGGLALAALLA